MKAYRIYPEAFIARIKGAMRAGLTPKVLARWTGIPHNTLKSWSAQNVRASIEPDVSVLEDLRLALLKEN